MQSELPKVLHPLCGKPLIGYVVDSLKTAGIDDIVIVVGYRGDDVISFLNNRVKYVWQHEQLGTGHAVMQAEDFFRGHDGYVIVACGDVPLISPETFQDLIRESDSNNTGAVVLTMIQDNPKGYGRIVKKDGRFIRIVEEKDATEEQRRITEVNSGTYIFKTGLLFEGLKHITTENAQGEYYLPDALEYIIESGMRVGTLLLKDSVEGRGINTREELASLERYVLEKKREGSDE